ncbi:MAG: hypothetical protein AAF149_24650 [Bacteroidota bacterium]
MMKYFGYILVVIHSILWLWSAGGIIEMTAIKVSWTPYTNLDFPNWLLPIHWGSVMITSIGFLGGYFSRWSGLPHFMLAAYSMLFTICVIETFGFMTSSTKYIAMIAELVAYTLILVLLFKNKYFIKYFN